MTRPGVLSAADLDRIQSEFGVASEQVRRDHAISHVLAAIARAACADDVIFFGGTALSRTLLPSLRLSEDIDLMTGAPRSDVARDIEQAIARGLQRTHGAVSWEPSLMAAKGAEPAVLNLDGTIRVRVQLLSTTGYARWPLVRRELEQRYADAPAASLLTPTTPALVASKAIAWGDRRTPRDLYDLWGLAGAGQIDRSAFTLLAKEGPLVRPDINRLFSEAPSEEEWVSALAHQCRIKVRPAEALAVVRDAWLRSTIGG